MQHDLKKHIQFHTVSAKLPFKLALASISLQYAEENWQQIRLDNGFSRFGHEILESVCERIGYSHVLLQKEVSGRPFGVMNDGSRLDLSVSHSSQMLWCAISPGNRIGVDAEPTDRKVPDGLQNRMMHTNDYFTLRVKPIRLWTIKESILKLLGTGLRTNMSSIPVKRITDVLFESALNGKTIRCMSECIDSHWVSVAYYH